MSSKPKTYDEQAELTEYIWRGYRHLMTPDERLADHAFSVESKMRHSGPALLEQRQRYENNSYVQEALHRGYKGYKEMVRDRIVADVPETFFVNRCPVCQRIVATPAAKQCLWCGEDWHGTKD